MKLNFNKKIIYIGIALSAIFLLILVFVIPSRTFALDTTEYISINNVSSMINAKDLQEGDKVRTKGYYSSTDGGGAIYYIRKKTQEEIRDNSLIDGLKVVLLNNGLIAHLQMNNPYYFNVRQLGVEDNSSKRLNDKDRADNNTNIINKILSKNNNTITLFFPSGRYLINEINISSSNNVIIEGVSNDFASIFNYDGNGDVYSELLLYDSKRTEPVIKFRETGNNLTINNMALFGSFYGCDNGLRRDKCAKTSPKYGNVNSNFIGGDNKDKLIVIKNSAIVQWGTAIGNEKENISKKSLTQISPNATIKVNIRKTRFTLNYIAIGNVNSSSIEETSFNSNDFALVFDGKVGNNVIKHCRVEWSRANGVYIKGNENGAPYNIAIDNTEFDRSNWAMIYLDYIGNNKPNGIKIIGNVLRRSAGDEINDEKKNRHLWINGCKNCEVKYNYTKRQCKLDTSNCGGSVPDYVSTFKNCENIIVEYNDFTGGDASKTMNSVSNSGNLTINSLEKYNVIK